MMIMMVVVVVVMMMMFASTTHCERVQGQLAWLMPGGKADISA
jgi:hypothetical protein